MGWEREAGGFNPQLGAAARGVVTADGGEGIGVVVVVAQALELLEGWKSVRFGFQDQEPALAGVVVHIEEKAVLTVPCEANVEVSTVIDSG